LQRSLKLSSIVISHDPALIGQVCSRIIVMYAGRVMEEAPTAAIFDEPKNPYTKRLLTSIMHVQSGHKKLGGIPGKPPGLVNPPPGCRFWPRCDYAQPVCKEKQPQLTEVGTKHYAACHMLGVINDKG
ncbi:oligopeptide/dipeptide ABC transporter ATP-binding protein, partial [Chloroflexota bacterium]